MPTRAGRYASACSPACLFARSQPACLLARRLPARPAACAPTHGPLVRGTAPEDTVPAAARVGDVPLVTCAPAHPCTRAPVHPRPRAPAHRARRTGAAAEPLVAADRLFAADGLAHAAGPGRTGALDAPTPRGRARAYFAGSTRDDHARVTPPGAPGV
ncbi:MULTISPECIES: hypothetical protein [unclassified Streptomyces]|uniref:hypothetical protein n=1 Tax=unclassified Streptomyces TaxID=2593676 RepID=UPI00344BB961